VTRTVHVWTIEAGSIQALRPRLCEILIDSVDHGASVGFLGPLDADDADVYWRGVERAVAEGRTELLVSSLSDDVVAGTVQLDTDTPANQPHRASVTKLLVHSSARGHGVGAALMIGLEQVALSKDRWLLTLDTATVEAKRLYERLGWVQAGRIPRYALNPDGTYTDTWLYWKDIAHQ
jgi:ribosomal protein S18 acetylase RimI-like enzyme